MSVDVHAEVVAGSDEGVPATAESPGWSTDEDLRAHLLTDPPAADTVAEQSNAVVDVTEPPVDVAVAAPAEQELAAAPSDELVQMRQINAQQNERFDKLLALMEKQSTPAETPKVPEPDPWSRPSVDHLRESAKVRLGAVSPQLIDQYTDQVSKLARWENSSADTPDRERNISSIQGNLRELHLRARHETELKTMESGFEKRLAVLEGQPKQAAAAKRVESTIRTKFTPDHLDKAGYSNLAAAAKAGSLNIDVVLKGVDFAAMDLSDPSTFRGLDDRLDLCNDLLSGASSNATAPAAAIPKIATQATPSEGVRLANASALAIPDQSGSAEVQKPRFWQEEEYNAAMKRHLTSTAN